MTSLQAAQLGTQADLRRTQHRQRADLHSRRALRCASPAPGSQGPLAHSHLWLRLGCAASGRNF